MKFYHALEMAHVINTKFNGTYKHCGETLPAVIAQVVRINPDDPIIPVMDGDDGWKIRVRELKE